MLITQSCYSALDRASFVLITIWPSQLAHAQCFNRQLIDWPGNGEQGEKRRWRIYLLSRLQKEQQNHWGTCAGSDLVFMVESGLHIQKGLLSTSIPWKHSSSIRGHSLNSISIFFLWSWVYHLDYSGIHFFIQRMEEKEMSALPTLQTYSEYQIR